MMAFWQWLNTDRGFWVLFSVLLLAWFVSIILEGRISKKTKRLSKALYDNNFVPKMDHEYRHRFLPWRRYQVFGIQPDTTHGPASVLVQKKGKYHWCSDIPLSVFNARYKEIE